MSVLCSSVLLEQKVTSGCVRISIYWPMRRGLCNTYFRGNGASSQYTPFTAASYPHLLEGKGLLRHLEMVGHILPQLVGLAEALESGQKMFT